MVDEPSQSASQEVATQQPRTLFSLLDRIEQFEKAIEPLADRVDAAIARLTEKIGILRAKAADAHALLDDLEKLKL